MKTNRRWTTPAILALLFSVALVWVQQAAVAQGPGTEAGQWTYLGADAWHTRFTPADQITPGELRRPGSRVGLARGQLWP